PDAEYGHHERGGSPSPDSQRGTATADPAWWARTSVASYNSDVEAAGVDVYYTCPEPHPQFEGLLRVEMTQGDISGTGTWPVRCPTSGQQLAHVTVDTGDDEDVTFDPDKLARTRVLIGQGFIGTGVMSSVEYTADWRTVCLHGGNAERCPQ
ncbi:hypothetical protein, partial [Streptomyces flaveolus]|uniref:hypothetical protein n=1 Tax=Streptomyces flaveolus TaxID=67297 RepID=UPI0033DB663F